MSALRNRSRTSKSLKTSIALRAATLGCVALLSARAEATVRTWTGGGANDNWNTTANWGGTGPAPWDDLVFSGSVRPTPFNNFGAGTIFGNVSFGAAASAFTVGGTNAFGLAGGITNSSASNQILNTPFALLAGNHAISNTAAGNLTINGVVTRNAGATAQFSASGAGTIVLTNNFTTNGILSSAASPDGVAYATVGGTDWATIGGGNTVVALSSYQTNSDSTTWVATDNVSLSGNPLANLNDVSVNSLKFAGSSAVTLDSGKTLTLGTGGLLVSGAGTDSISGGTLLGAGGANKELVVIQNNVTNAFTINSVIADNGGASTLTKAGAGTLNLNGANNYTGNTIITGGSVVLGASASLGTGGLTIGGASSAASLDLSSASATVGGLTVSNGVGSANTITIGSTRTLTVNGNTTIGGLTGNTNAAIASSLVVSGAGTLALGNGSGVLLVQNRANANGPAVMTATLDLTNLATFTANYGASGVISVGAGTTGLGENAPFGSMILAASNTLTAGTLGVGINNGGGNVGNGSLQLGASNNINVDTIEVGAGKTATLPTGIISFRSGLTTPSVTIRGSSGGSSRVTNFNIADGNIYVPSSGTAMAGTVDLTAGSVNALVDNLKVGIGKSTANTATSTGLLTYSTGTIDATTVVIGVRGTTVGAANTVGTITVGGTASLVAGSGGIKLADTSVGSSLGTTTGNLNINGTASVTTSGDIVGGGGTSNVTLNGGTLNLQNFNLGTGAGPITNLNLQTGTIQNVAEINGGGGWTKGVAGTLIIAGTNTYTGNTNLNLGAINVTGSLGATSNTIVNTGTTLNAAGNGTTTGLLGNVTLGGGSVRPGASASDGSVGTLTANNLTVNSGDLRFDLSTPAGSNDRINLLGTASFNGASTISLVTTPSAGTYTLLSAGSALSLGTAPTMNVPTGTRTTYLLDNTTDDTKLLLTVGSAPLNILWTGTAGTPWDLTTVNWSNSGGLTNDKFFNQDNVTFDNTGATKGVTLDTQVLPGSITVNNSGVGNDYVISGTGDISGPTGLAKTGSGKLTILTNNTYSGATTIAAGGTLQIGDANGGSGTLGSGAVTTNGTLAFFRGDTVTVTNDIGGSGAVQQLGSGTLILSGTNAYGGNTTISAGTVQVGNGGSTGSLGSGNVTNNGALSFNRTGALTVAGNISGTGSVAQNGTGVVTLSGANSYSGATNLNAGTLAFTTLGNLGSGTAINFNGGTLQYTIGAGNVDVSTRTISLGGSGTIDTNGNNVTFANGIGNGGGGGFVKAGAGSLTIGAANSYGGTTTVAGGTLVLTGGGTLGSGGLIMGAGAGTGTLDLTAVSLAVPSLNASSNGAGVNSIVIGSGKTLTVNGNVVVGGFVANNSTTNLTIGGAGGALSAVSSGGTFLVGNQANGNAPNTASATLDLSTLSSVVLNYGGGGVIGVGTGAGGASGNGTFGTLTLGANNTLTAGSLNVGFNNGGANTGASLLKLGTVNVLNVDNVLVGAGKSGLITGSIAFNSGLTSPSVTLRAADGVSRVATVKIADYSGITAGSSTANTANIDLTSGSVNALVASLTIGIGKEVSGTPTTTGALTFNSGTFDATTVVLGVQGSSVSAPTSGTLTVAGSGNLIVGTGGIMLSSAPSPVATISATLNVNGGSATIGADVIDGGGTSTVNLAGGTTNMQTFKLGTSAAPLDTVNFSGGALNNATEVNTTNANVTAGTFLLQPGTTLNAVTITVSNGATANLNGPIAASATVNANGATNFGGSTTAAVLNRPLAALNVGSGATAKISPSTFPFTPAVLAPATIGFADPTAKLDLTNNELIVNEDLPTTVTRLGAGQYFTTSAGGALGTLALSGSQTEVRFTLLGDTNLDGKVDVTDLGNLASSYGTPSGATWVQGDTNYSGAVDVTDLGNLASNYGGQLATGPSGGGADLLAEALATVGSTAAGGAGVAGVVPEPSSAMAAGALLMGLISRRRRRV